MRHLPSLSYRCLLLCCASFCACLWHSGCCNENQATAHCSTADASINHTSRPCVSVVLADMCSTNQALAARQAEAMSNVSQELFCSPEIIRQGPMDLWRPKTSSWENVHFVLTRAGFLHWFKSMEEVTPQEPPLNLCRCESRASAVAASGWLLLAWCIEYVDVACQLALLRCC